MNEHLVFIHGSGDSGRVWRLQTEYFDTRPTIALDLPGHGERLDTLPAEVTVQMYAHAAHTVMTQELHLHKPIIIGHSLGGAIALTLALDYKNDIGGLVLIGTGARLRILPTILADAKNAPEQARSALAKLGIAATTTPAVAQAMLAEQHIPGPTILHRDLAACDVFDVIQRLYEVSVPTLIMCGVEDQLTPVKYSQYLHKHIQKSTLLLIPNAGHYVLREQPQAINRGLAEWLDTAFSPSTH